MNDEDCYHIDELDNENTKDQQNENHIFTSFAATSTMTPIVPDIVPGILYTHQTFGLSKMDILDPRGQQVTRALPVQPDTLVLLDTLGPPVTLVSLDTRDPPAIPDTPDLLVQPVCQEISI